MAKQNINVGTAANDKKGDSLRAAFQKVNANFTELYTALGINADVDLNLGAFEFTGSTLSTTDSTAIVIDQATIVTSNLTVGGDILPQTAHGGDLGSSTLPWRSLYVSNNTIFLGGIALSVDAGGNLLVDGSLVTGGGGSSVTTSATAPADPSLGDLWYDTASGRTYVYYDASWVDASPVDGVGITSYNDLTNKPTLFSGSYNDLTNKPNLGGTYQFSVAADDSTQRLISTDEVIKFVGAGGVTTASDAEGNITITGTIPSSLVNGAYSVEVESTGAFKVNAQGIVSGSQLAIEGNGAVQIQTANFGPYISVWNEGNTKEINLVLVDNAEDPYSPTWTFNTDHTLILPDDSRIKSATNIDITIDTPDSSTFNWRFGADGTLTLPAGSSRVTSYGQLTLETDNSGSGMYANATGVNLLYANTNVTLRSNTAGTTKDWTFGSDGALTIPGDIKSDGNINIDINLADSTLRRWQFGEDGALTLPSVGKINNGAYDWTFGSTGNTTFPTGLTLGAPRGVGTVNFTAAVDKEFQIETGTATSGKLWQFGTDGSLQIPGDIKSNGNINIDINLADSTLYRWQFGEDGELTIPGSIIGNDTIEINNRDSGNTADINLYSADDILIQARDREGDSGSEGGDINIYAGDSAVGSDATGGDVQIRGGDGGAGDGYDNGGSGGFVTINGGNGGAASGIYSARNGGYLTLRAGNAGNNGGNIDLGAEGGNVTINAGDSTGNGLNGGTIYLTSGAADASALAGDVVIQAGGTWTFGGDGALTIPGDIKSNGNINIDINLIDSTLRRWQFGEDGDLILPAGGDIKNSTGTSVLGGSVSNLVNGTETFTLSAAGNATFSGETGGINRGIVWDYGAVAGGVNSRIRQDEDGLTVRAYTENGGNHAAPVRILTNQGDNERVWQFNGAGNLTLPGGITFPDGTIQSTAFSFSVAADDSTQRVINNNELIKFIGAGGITTASDAEGYITITGSGGGTSIPTVVTTGAVGVNGAAHAKVQFTVTSSTEVTAVGVTVIGVSVPANSRITLSGSPGTGSFDIVAVATYTTPGDTYIFTPFATNASGTGYGAPIAGEGTNPCLVRGTMITMADMSRVAVENITYHDDILVWDFDLGEFASAKPIWIKKTQTAVVSCLLTFSDHSELRIVGESPKAHRIFNKEAGKFTYGSMPETPIGTTTFNDRGEEITLISKEWIVGEVEFYNVMTDYHMNLFANSILTSMRYNNVYPITDMKFVKDSRTLRTADDYPNVEERLYKGFRLAEQTQSVEEILTHIQWLLSLEVERETESV